jgi:hypothetical protein
MIAMAMPPSKIATHRAMIGRRRRVRMLGVSTIGPPMTASSRASPTGGAGANAAAGATGGDPGGGAPCGGAEAGGDGAGAPLAQAVEQKVITLAPTMRATGARAGSMGALQVGQAEGTATIYATGYGKTSTASSPCSAMSAST